MVGTCSTHGKLHLEILKGIDHLEDTDVDGRMSLKK
jgi:hypothetical protein